MSRTWHPHPPPVARALFVALATLLASPALADDDRPSEEALFGEEATEVAAEPDVERTFVMGGSLYLRLQSYVAWEGALEDQRLVMPNLLDLYADARPDPRVRAFASARLRFDPTVEEGDLDFIGQPATSTDVTLDQLWIKTDLARIVYLTAGVQRIKWGASRLWNPTDFLNAQRKNPLDFFDDRTGVTLLKVHVPIESVGWNAYGIALFDGASRLEDVGGALRLEMVAGTAEFALSATAGKGRKTSYGLDVSVGLWDVDFHAEASLTDEAGTPHYEGVFDISDLAAPILPTERVRAAHYGRMSTGFTYTFKSSDTDIMALGAEYFYNPLGTSDKGLYPWLIAMGQFEPFYMGQHYAAAFWLVPAPGSWDDVTFTTSTLANLSDMSFVSRLDMGLSIHHKLRLEAFVMVHYGSPGGEFRFEFEVPEGASDLVGQPVPEGKIAAPMIDVGLHLRVSM